MRCNLLFEKRLGQLLCYTNVFSPDVPKTIEEFSANIKMMKFNVKIDGDEYEIIFEKNDHGELEVSSLIPTND